MAMGLSTLLPQANAAIECRDCGGSKFTTINTMLSINENQVGTTRSSVTIPTDNVHYVGRVREPTNWWFTYAGQNVVPPNTLNSTWSYWPVDEYISVGIKVTHPECNRTFYAPYNVPVLINGSCRLGINATGFTSINLQTQIKLTKRIISGTYTNNIYIGEMGVCTGGTCANKELVINRIYLMLNITSPQTCEINTDKVVIVTFDDIPVSAFNQASAMTPVGSAKMVPVTVKCDNMASSEALTMRIQSNKVSGNALVSNNPNVGFTISDYNSGRPLTPNSLSSYIPFFLGSSNAYQAEVKLSVSPTKLTGNTNVNPGYVTSEGYLRIDFP